MSLRVVLVRPRNPLNIGAAARAMANFGFEDLVVVDPYEPIWRETVSAVGAEDLVLNARAVKTLREAVGDCQLVLGTTAVRERQMKRTVVRLPDLKNYLRKQAGGKRLKIAVLFGPEKTGLGKQDLEHCSAALTIPTSPKQPSMNLSHAVALCCYEFSRENMDAGPMNSGLATSDECERLLKQVLELFDAAGYLSGDSPQQKAQKIRRSFLQWKLQSTDVRWLHGILRALINKLK